ncbi:MAG TPA: ATP-binding protein [Ktedonobacterales bacterium]|nr:ATP-binding protein [Ktedonobacterales bacterium]
MSYDGALGPLFMRIAEQLHFDMIVFMLLVQTEGNESVLQGIAGLNIEREALERLSIPLASEAEPLARVAQSGIPATGPAKLPEDDAPSALQTLLSACDWAAVPVPYLPSLPLVVDGSALRPALPLEQNPAAGTESTGSDKSMRSDKTMNLPARGVLLAARAAPIAPQDVGALELGAGQVSAALLGLEAAQDARMDELEEGRIRQQLFESEKLAATGRLTASIAHEINNPLEAIKNALYLLVAGSKPDDPQREFLELAQRETERVSRIIRQMLGVARPSVSMTPTDVNKVVQEVLALVEPQLRRRHILPRLELDETLPLIQASADQLKQVFLNLFLNARDAMPNGGELLLQTRIAQRQDSVVLAEKHLVVRVRDDGEGIPEEIRRRVFEPFFSTKGARRGTGLGLWVCQEIIRSHGGQIQVNSKLGKGTTFLVGLPLPQDHKPYTSQSSALTDEQRANTARVEEYYESQ